MKLTTDYKNQKDKENVEAVIQALSPESLTGIKAEINRLNAGTKPRNIIQFRTRNGLGANFNREEHENITQFVFNVLAYDNWPTDLPEIYRNIQEAANALEARRTVALMDPPEPSSPHRIDRSGTPTPPISSSNPPPAPPEASPLPILSVSPVFSTFVEPETSASNTPLPTSNPGKRVFGLIVGAVLAVAFTVAAVGGIMAGIGALMSTSIVGTIVGLPTAAIGGILVGSALTVMGVASLGAWTGYKITGPKVDETAAPTDPRTIPDLPSPRRTLLSQANNPSTQSVVRGQNFFTRRPLHAVDSRSDGISPPKP